MPRRRIPISIVINVSGGTGGDIASISGDGLVPDPNDPNSMAVNAGDGISIYNDSVNVKPADSTIISNGTGVKLADLPRHTVMVGNDENRPTAAVPVYREFPTGYINGVNKVFALAHVPIIETLELHVSILTMEPNDDYTIVDNIITMAIAPDEGESLWANYLYIA